MFTAGWQGRQSRDELARLRVGAVVMPVLLLAMAVLLAAAYARDAPLRGAGLVSAQGDVVDYDSSRRGADRIEVRYEVTGAGLRSASIPVGSRYAVGDQVEVLYLPDDPGRARTARDWQPASQPWVVAVGLTLPLLGWLLVVWQLRSRRRRAAQEAAS